MDAPLTPEGPPPEDVPRRIPEVPWSPVEALPVALLVLVFTGLATAAVAAATRDEGLTLLLGALVFEVALAGGCLLWVRLLHRSRPSAFGFSAESLGRRTAVGLGSGVALFAVTVLVVGPALYALLGLLTGTPVQPPEQPVLPPDPTSGHIALGALAVLVAAPFGEEIFFRGFMYGSLRTRLGFWGAAVMSSAVFAAFHVIPLLMPLMFFVGMGMAYLYERSGSLTVPIAAHAAFNVVGYTFIVLPLVR